MLLTAVDHLDCSTGFERSNIKGRHLSVYSEWAISFMDEYNIPLREIWVSTWAYQYSINDIIR